MAAQRVVESPRQNASDDSGEAATQRCLKMSDFKTDHATKVDSSKRRSRIEAYRSDYEHDYSEWKSNLLAREKKPNVQQWQVLNLVHQRCLYEQDEEMNRCINKEPSDDLGASLPLDTRTTRFWEKRATEMDADLLRRSLALDEWRTVPIPRTFELDGSGNRWPYSAFMGLY